MPTSTPRVRIAGLRVRTKGGWEGNALVAVRESCRASVALEKAVAEAIQGVHTAGRSWDEIGRTLGVAEHADDKRALIDAFADSRRVVTRVPASADKLTLK